jgi:hypothetical protein
MNQQIDHFLLVVELFLQVHGFGIRLFLLLNSLSKFSPEFSNFKFQLANQLQLGVLASLGFGESGAHFFFESFEFFLVLKLHVSELFGLVLQFLVEIFDFIAE